MATINIRRDVTDPFYRYKMEKLQSKIEGKGNGIKTVVVNLTSVAHSLARPPSYVIKYFGFELGAQTNTNPNDDRWIINGAHEAGKLQDYLDGFINKFVLCKMCKNPETDINIKDGHILLDCKACGKRSDVDLRLKLSSFIIKNQPKKGKKDKSTKKAERKAKKEANQNGHDGSENGSPHDSNGDDGDNNGDFEQDAGSDDELTRNIKAGAEAIGDAKDAGDVEWTVDMSEKAVKARAQQLPDDLKRSLALNEDEDDEESGISNYDALGAWIQEQAKEKDGINNVSSDDILKKATELGIESKHRTLTVLAQTVFDENLIKQKQIQARGKMLSEMIHGTEKLPRSDTKRHQRAFLGGLERFVGKDNPALLDQMKAILATLYFENVITEEAILAWAAKPSIKFVDKSTNRKMRKCEGTADFCKWLEEAEEEDDSDEE